MSFRGHDINTESEEVATSVSGRNIRCKEWRLRRHLAIARSDAKNGGRDVIQRSRHQMQRMEVAMSFSGRDIKCKEWRSRHHLTIATSVARN